MPVFYKGFLIKQALKASPDSAPKFIATLQGVRFTAFSVTALQDKIDRNSKMIADMSNQGFKRDAVVNSAMFDPSDNLLEPYEIAVIARSYAPRGVEYHG